MFDKVAIRVLRPTTTWANDPELAFQYAIVLERNDKLEDAQRYYEFCLRKKRNVFQVTVSRNYANLLIKMGKTQKAKQFIYSIRKREQNASDFMKAELAQVAGI